MTAFTVLGSDLSRATAWVARLIPAHPAVTVLSGMLLECGDNLSLSAFDYDTAATMRIPCATTEPGRVLVSGKLLAAIAKTVPGGSDVHISTDEGRVLVRCGRSKWSLPALPVDDYPQLPALGATVGGVRSGDFQRALACVLPAVSTEDGMEMLSGVRIEADTGGLTLVATDRFRLPTVTVAWEPSLGATLPSAVIVPASLLDLVVRLGGDDATPLALSWSDTLFGIATASGSHTIVGRQLAVEFPRWSHLIPKPGAWHATVDVDVLSAAVTGAAVTTSGPAPNLVLRFGAAEVEVAANCFDGDSDCTVDIAMKGEPIAVRVNARYLLDCLTAQSASEITMYFSSPGKPILVTGAGDPTMRYLLMPMRMT